MALFRAPPPEPGAFSGGAPFFPVPRRVGVPSETGAVPWLPRPLRAPLGCVVPSGLFYFPAALHRPGLAAERSARGHLRAARTKTRGRRCAASILMRGWGGGGG